MKMEKVDEIQRQKAKGKNKTRTQMENWGVHTKLEERTTPSRNRGRKLREIKRMKLEETNRPN